MLALTEPFELSAAFAGRARPVRLCDDLAMLGRFRAKMAGQDVQVNVARMMFDRSYAFDRIALAHSCADASVQRLALRLYAHYAGPASTSH